jgi:hypothetical protein
VLVVDGLHPPVRADGAGVCKVAVEPRRSDECDHALRGRRDLLDGAARRAHEPRPEQEVLGRIPGDGELGEDDEIRLCPSRAVEVAQDLLAVAVEVADDGVQLCECDPQGFRLTVTNLV